MMIRRRPCPRPRSRRAMTAVHFRSAESARRSPHVIVSFLLPSAPRVCNSGYGWDPTHSLPMLVFPCASAKARHSTSTVSVSTTLEPLTTSSLANSLDSGGVWRRRPLHPRTPPSYSLDSVRVWRPPPSSNVSAALRRRIPWTLLVSGILRCGVIPCVQCTLPFFAQTDSVCMLRSRPASFAATHAPARPHLPSPSFTTCIRTHEHALALILAIIDSRNVHSRNTLHASSALARHTFILTRPPQPSRYTRPRSPITNGLETR